jgi:chromosomal replication initiator protein
MGALEERLRERFEAGLITDIAPPDHRMRAAVLRKRAQQDDVHVHADDVIDVIAGRVDGSVRELEGALIRVVAFASLTGRELTPALTDDVLANLYPGTTGRPGTRPGPPTIDRIQQVVCDAFSLTRDELLSSSRAARVAGPRQLAMFLAREHTEASLPAIGTAFAGRNHTTVMHAVKKVRERLESDDDAREIVRDLTARLRAD